MALKVELSKFKVKQGKSHIVDEWMKLLNGNMDKVLLTLHDEKMFVETIFREKQGDGEYLYWYSIQGEGGVYVEDSHHDIDKKHLEYWYECIDEEEPDVDMKAEIVMIQESVQRVLE